MRVTKFNAHHIYVYVCICLIIFRCRLCIRSTFSTFHLQPPLRDTVSGNETRTFQTPRAIYMSTVENYNPRFAHPLFSLRLDKVCVVHMRERCQPRLPAKNHVLETRSRPARGGGGGGGGGTGRETIDSIQRSLCELNKQAVSKTSFTKTL